MSNTGQRVGRHPDPRAVAVLGAATGLALPTLVNGLLLPVVDEYPPRSFCLAVMGLTLTAGWMGAARRAGGVSARRLWVWAALVSTGGWLSAWVLEPTRESFVEQLVNGPHLPGSLLLGGASLLVGAPLLLPLGALLGAAQDGRPATRGASWLGLGAGLALQPWLSQVVLGHIACLAVAAVLAGAASLPLAEAAPLMPAREPLTWTRVCSAVALGALISLLLLLAPAWIDLGPTAGALLLGAMGLGAALASRWSRRAFDSWTLLPWLGLPWLLRDALPAGVRPSNDLSSQALVCLALGLVLGWMLGALCKPAAAPARTAREAKGTDRPGAPNLSLLPALVLLPAPCVLLLLIPRGGLLGTTLAIAALLLAGRLLDRQANPVRWGRATTLAALGAALALPGPLGWLSNPAPRARSLVGAGLLERVVDPASGEELLAVDGRATLGRSPLQARRLVQLPLLLQAGCSAARPPHRVLIVAQDLGQAARSGALFGPARLDWLQPLPDPWSRPASQVVLAHGNERLHLLQQDAPHDAIVLLPDPRVRRRMGLAGSREWFSLLTARLSPSGLFCQWFDLSAVDLTDLKAVIGAALGACPNVCLLMDHPRSRDGMLAIVGSGRKLVIHPERISARLSRLPDVAQDLARVGLDGLLTAALITQDSGVLRILTPAERGLSDQRPTLGVRAGLRPVPEPATLIRNLDFFASRRCDPRAWIAVPAAQRPALRAHTRDILAGWQHLYGGAQALLALSGGQVPPFEEEPLKHMQPVEIEGLVEALANLSDWTWLTEQVRRLAQTLESDGKPGQAESLLRRAVEKAPASARLRFALARLMEHRGKRDDACVLYRTVLAFDPEHQGATEALARLCGEDAADR